MTGLRDKICYFGYEPANYIIKVYPNVAYLSIYLSALEDILIVNIYLLTGRPDARKTHTQPGRPHSFFVARHSLKYGEKSYCIAYFNEFYLTFSQNRVKIGPKFVL